jgi:hypothetical protein
MEPMPGQIDETDLDELFRASVLSLQSLHFMSIQELERQLQGLHSEYHIMPPAVGGKDGCTVDEGRNASRATNWAQFYMNEIITL